ncbi:MAG: hypothetical protein WC340_17510, partial [Kiritimatiellia bacterium]
MIIFGYTWDEIKRAQQGGALARRIPAGIYKPLATDGDWELLEQYGEDGLRSRGYFGVLDRLENTRLASEMPEVTPVERRAAVARSAQEPTEATQGRFNAAPERRRNPPTLGGGGCQVEGRVNAALAQGQGGSDDA